MSAPFAWLVVAAVSVAALLAMLRTWRHATRLRASLLLLQPVIAAALAAALLLPHAPGPSRIHVLTQGADAGALPRKAIAVRLPGAAPADGVAAWPDLASVLRAHHQIDSLVVHGHGLGEEDLAALGDRSVAFDPAPAPQGIVALDAPSQVRAGARFPIHGRVRSTGATVLRLFDPAGGLHAEATPDADGRFALDALVPAPGRHAFSLALVADGEQVPAVPIAVAATTPAPQRGLLLAAAPSAELRALRRWAMDAGLELDARISLAPGLPLQDGAVRLDATTLDQAELLILDERSWPTSNAERAALRDAVQGGLGVLLRVTGPLPRSLQDALAELSASGGAAGAATTASPLAMAGTGDAPEAVLWPATATPPAGALDAGAQQSGDTIEPHVSATPPAGAPGAGAQPSADMIELHAWPLRFATDAAALLTAGDGRVLAAWRPVGQGRVGVLALADTFRLEARAGRTEYATLWSQLWSRLARGTARDPLTVSPPPIQGRRVAVCGGPANLVVTGPDGTTRPLLRDAAARDCAAWYPQSAGWHRIASGPSSQDVHVADADHAATLLQEARRTATAARAQDGAQATPHPARTWPWRPILLAAWLLLLALAWLLERRANR